MADLFVGNETYQFVSLSGNLPYDRTSLSSIYDSSATRSGVWQGGGSFRTAYFTPTSDLWAHSKTYHGNTSSDAERGLSLRDTAGTIFAYFYWNRESASVYVWDGSAYQIQSIPNWGNAQRRNLDIHYDWTGGRVAFYVDGSEVHTYTGTLPASAPQITNLYFNNDLGSGFSEIIASTTSTIGRRLELEAPNGDGLDAVDGAGTFTDIDELGLSDSDALVLPAAGNKRSFTSPARTVTGAGLVAKSVTPVARMKRGVTGPQNARFYLVVGGTRYFGPTISLTDGLEVYWHSWDTNPATGSPWSMTDAQAASLEWGVEALA